ncbi:MAG: PEP-CTERM sorting domain-containing protein [Terriglobales bacterium]|jgi:hypothetical protein
MTDVRFDVAKRRLFVARVIAFVLIVAAVVFAPRTTRADNCSVDTCVAYNVTGTFTDGGGLSGAFVVDESNGTIANSTFLADGTSYSSGQYYIYQFPAVTGPDVFNAFSTGGTELTIQFGPFTLSSLPQSFGLSDSTHVVSASGAWMYLNPGAGAVAAPEPASWLLLLMGSLVIGLLNLGRRHSLRCE